MGEYLPWTTRCFTPYMSITYSYFQNPIFTLTYEAEWELGTIALEGFLSSADLQEAMRQGLALIAEYKPLRWLADNRKMKGVRQADQAWFADQVLPRVLASSIRRHALVGSEDIFNQIVVEQVLKWVGPSIALKEFAHPQQALAWLKQPFTAGKL